MSDRGDWMQTYSGIAFFPLDPRPEDVRIVDIAHALAHQCRFAGHSLVFYSVAEHCVRASRLLEDRTLAVTALLHDAAEAYAQDIIRPIKRMLRQSGVYDKIEDRIAEAIGERFCVDLCNLDPEVKRADEIMLATEARDVMAPAPRAWMPLPDPLPGRIVAWSPQGAKMHFLERFTELIDG